jgi:poly(A) polymerase
MKLPHVEWMDAKGLKALLNAVDQQGAMTRFVGGCVRDTLLGLPVTDVDLATRLRPEDVMQRLQVARIRAVPTGIAHGTVTAVAGGKPYEVTSLRRDVATDGRRATIAYTDDWKEDAGRRDFTINALSADPITGEVYDYFGGEADLEARLVRFIGDPLTRIAEDHLRILRFFRFHARFGIGEPDADALEACSARANDLMALSRERIADELLKLLALPDPAPTAALMAERGIFAPVLPEIGAEGVARLERLIRSERAAGEAPEPLRRFSALLPPDPSAAAAVAARLRLSKKAAKRLISAAQRSGEQIAEPRELAYRIGVEEAIDRLLLNEDAPGKVAALRSWAMPRFPLGGGEIIGMGLPPGPVVARTLQEIERDWVAAGFPLDEGELRALARRRVDQALADSG